ncbi:MAG: hypothetical protein KA015_02245 [Spirochaetes bacterium]|nr:hypothetical protein [Spirochaetota bacterium]
MRLLFIISTFFSSVFMFSLVLESKTFQEGVSAKTPLPADSFFSESFDVENQTNDYAYTCAKQNEYVELTKEIIEIDENHFISTPSEAPNEDPVKIRTAVINGTYYFKNNSGKKQTVAFVMPISKSVFIDFKVMMKNRLVKHSVTDSYKMIFSEMFYRDSFPENIQEILFKNNLAEIPEYDHQLLDLSNLFYLTGNYSRLAEKIKKIPDITPDEQNQIMDHIFGELLDAYRGNVGGFPYNGGSLSLYSFNIPINPQETVKLNLSYSLIISEAYSKNFRYSYILKTGKLWKGHVGESVIRIKPGCPESMMNYEINPKTYKLLKSNVLEFSFKNFEPDFDIYVNYAESKKK